MVYIRQVNFDVNKNVLLRELVCRFQLSILVYSLYENVISWNNRSAGQVFFDFEVQGCLESTCLSCIETTDNIRYS